MSRYERFLNIAEKLAQERNFDVRFPFVCLLTRGSKIISIGYNSHKTHPCAVDTRMESLHAELDCIRRANETEGTTMYVLRLRKTGFGKAKPCPVCEAAIKKAKIKKVIYTNTSDSLAYTVVKQ